LLDKSSRNDCNSGSQGYSTNITAIIIIIIIIIITTTTTTTRRLSVSIGTNNQGNEYK
jgi:hypothetical protein